MSETRYCDTYQNGQLISHEPYTVSDAQLAEELADRRMIELRELLKQGASVIVSIPVTGEFRVQSIQQASNGDTITKYDNVAV